MSNFHANVWVVGGSKTSTEIVDAVNDALGAEFVLTAGDAVALAATGDLLRDEQCILVVGDDTATTAYLCDTIMVTT